MFRFPIGDCDMLQCAHFVVNVARRANVVGSRHVEHGIRDLGIRHAFVPHPCDADAHFHVLVTTWKGFHWSITKQDVVVSHQPEANPG